MANRVKTEKDWEAEDDFRTLARAEEIKRDKKRMGKARKAGTNVLKEKKEEIIAIAAVAKPRKIKIRNDEGKIVIIRKGAKKPVKIKKNIKVY